MKKNNNIEFWRFVFTTLVCFYHFASNYFKDKLYNQGGFIAVEFFFILSGFLLMLSYSRNNSNQNNKKSAIKYTVNKALGLYPYYIFSFFVLFTYLMYQSKAPLTTVLKNLLYSIWEITMLQMAGIKCSIYNQPSWYISALIIAGYLIYYLLSHHTKIYIGLIAPFSVIFIYSYISIKTGHVNVWIDDIVFTKIALLRAFAGMSLGCICYNVYEKLKTYALNEKIHNILDLLGTLIFCFVICFTFYRDSPSFSFVLILFLAPGVIILFLEKGFIKKILDNKLSATLGKISYPMFLNHIFVMRVFVDIFPNKGIKIVPIYLLVVIIYSFFTFKIINIITLKVKNIFKTINIAGGERVMKI